MILFKSNYQKLLLYKIKYIVCFKIRYINFFFLLESTYLTNSEHIKLLKFSNIFFISLVLIKIYIFTAQMAVLCNFHLYFAVKNQWILFFVSVNFVEKWPLMNVNDVVFILATYLIFVLKVGPLIMEHRSPFQIKLVLLLYNMIKVVNSSVLAYKVSCFYFIIHNFPILMTAQHSRYGNIRKKKLICKKHKEK